jgi:HAD superfamily hydrolase (TIGR01509 family)
VIFDVDGTLVDTNYLHTLAWWRGLVAAGEQVPMAAIHRVIGMGSDILIKELLGHEVPDAKEIHSEQFKQLREEMKAFPRAADLLREVAGRGAKVVLASSANEEDLEAMRKAIDADDVIDVFTSAKDVETSKPAPDIFQVALDRAEVDADHAIVVGDTIWDIQAARKVGLDCVGVLTGGLGRGELEGAGAAAIYDSVGHLLDELDDSPLARLATSSD